MQFSDERLWQELVRTYLVSETGEEIIEFTRRWAEETEKLIDPSSADPLQYTTFRQSMDSGFLRAVEFPDQPGLKANSDMVREAIFLLTQVWEHGDELVRNLTVLETNMLETAFSLKIQSMQDDAADEAEKRDEDAAER